VAGNLRSAYKLLSDFKAGEVRPGSPITRPQQRLLRLAAKDLGVIGTEEAWPELVLAVARKDSFWNRRTQDCIHRLYSLHGSGRAAEEAAERSSFLEACPSAWYRSIVEAI
jgi:hypothetical protein